MEMDAGAVNVSIDVAGLVRREQALSLAQSMKVTLSANCLIAVSIVTMVWDRLPRTEMVFWAAAVLLINAARLLTVATALRANLENRRPELFLRQSWIGALVAGTAWAVFLPMAFYSGAGLSPAITFVVCGMSAGALIQSRAHRATVWLFILPISIALSACFFGLHTLEGYILSANVVIYVVMLGRSATNAERSFTTASRLKYEATELAASLKVANDVASGAVMRLEHLANHDPLTDLGNRTAFNAVFNHSLEDARLNHDEVTLMLIDLDRFKSINDTFGHSVGDQVLVAVARRLRERLGDDRFVARLGGDEFAIILTGQSGAKSTLDLASELIELISKPVTINDRQLAIGASIGFSLYPRDGYSVEELQISADLALYAAKAGGRGRVRCFDEKLRAATDARRVFELDLADALAHGNLEVWFQPQVSLREHRLIGLEGLIRWNHPNHGWVPPPEIVAAAAATRQSEALTGFVVEASCRMIRALTLAGYDDVSVSFNASPRELGSYSLAKLIGRMLETHDIAPDRLGVEITEEAMFSEERGGADLREIADMGVKIAVDDFGVGYSSFGALRNLKFDCIKIDRVFIEGLTSGAGDRALVQAILGVARALGVKAIAEGVESAEQLAVLASLGCNEVQGYYFAKPMPAKKVLEWVGDRADIKARSIPPVSDHRVGAHEMLVLTSPSRQQTA
jgi:diguanylate cyclase (GGDEF)-like protein